MLTAFELMSAINEASCSKNETNGEMDAIELYGDVSEAIDQADCAIACESVGFIEFANGANDIMIEAVLTKDAADVAYIVEAAGQGVKERFKAAIDKIIQAIRGILIKIRDFFKGIGTKIKETVQKFKSKKIKGERVAKVKGANEDAEGPAIDNWNDDLIDGTLCDRIMMNVEKGMKSLKDLIDRAHRDPDTEAVVTGMDNLAKSYKDVAIYKQLNVDVNDGENPKAEILDYLKTSGKATDKTASNITRRLDSTSKLEAKFTKTYDNAKKLLTDIEKAADKEFSSGSTVSGGEVSTVRTASDSAIFAGAQRAISALMGFLNNSMGALLSALSSRTSQYNAFLNFVAAKDVEEATLG